MRFGDGHSLQIEQVGQVAVLRLGDIARGVQLDASGPGCDFEKAINLLRLHMPRSIPAADR